MTASLQVSGTKSKQIDNIYKNNSRQESKKYKSIPKAADEVSSVLAGINPTLNDSEFCDILNEAEKLSQFKMTIGSTTTSDQSQYIVEDAVETDDDMTYNSEN